MTTGKINQVLEPVVAYKRSKIEDNCNTLLIAFRSGSAIQFRAYNDGVAYRFETSLKDDITVKNEIAELQFPAGSHAWYPLEESFMSHNERSFHLFIARYNRKNILQAFQHFSKPMGLIFFYRSRY